MGKRETTKKENRLTILQAAVKVFATIGYEASTVRDIVRESNLAIGTFYNYFKDKETILKKVMDHEAREIRFRLKTVRSDSKNARELVRNAYFSFLDVLSRDPLRLNMIARNSAAVRSALYQSRQLRSISIALEHDLQKAVQDNLIPPVRVDFVSWAMIGAGLEFLIRMAQNPSYKADDLADFLTNLFMCGLEKEPNRQ